MLVLFLFLQLSCYVRRTVMHKVHTSNHHLEGAHSLNSSDAAMVDCFKKRLYNSQDCSNNDVMFYERSGGNFFGLGSEFNYHLGGALMIAVSHKLRLVIVRDRSELVGYECPKLHFWECYLSFPCADSVVYFEETKGASADTSRRTFYYSQDSKLSSHAVPTVSDVIRSRYSGHKHSKLASFRLFEMTLQSTCLPTPSPPLLIL